MSPTICTVGGPLNVFHKTVVPDSWFGGAKRWFLAAARRYRFPEHINVGEIRVVVRILASLCAAGLPPRTTLVDLCDSMVPCFVLMKGRSSIYTLNREARRRAALELAFDVRCLIPWISTRWQLADIGTRPDEHGSLPTPQPIFICANLFIEVFVGSMRVTSAVRMCDVLVGMT